MQSSNPLTEEILENDLHISKIGHRHRLLSKLNSEKCTEIKQNTLKLDTEEKIPVCGACNIM